MLGAASPLGRDHGEDAPHEECGVFGIYAPGADAARLTFFALYALQHRGQEGAGICTFDDGVAHLHKGLGLVSQVFNEENVATLQGHHGIGHTRYSTTGAVTLRNTQPYVLETFDGPLALGHNGNLINSPQLRRELLERGVGLSSSSDTEVLIHLLAGAGGPGTDWVSRIRVLMARAEGAYTLTIGTRNAVYGVRDPWGLRPLVLGELDSGGYALASESCALATIGATMIAEIGPGEIVRLDDAGYAIIPGAVPRNLSFCTFEEIYFARPDSVFRGRLVHQTRQAIGRQLAREAPADADMVVPVPDSGIPHAIGYAQQSGIPYSEGLIKSRYIGRTFIEPTAELRRDKVRMKFNPLPANLEGRRVILVDDSIVRGTTSGPLVSLLRRAGAREVHLRVACPPIAHPCFMGVDMASRAELIAANMSVDEIAAHIGADSLAYLSIEGLLAALHEREGGPVLHVNGQSELGGYCNACFTGVYPFEGVPVDLESKERFAGIVGHG
ncbi:MAG: amidophosphoribosyltransferase [Acidimicrobiia bacterium]